MHFFFAESRDGHHQFILIVADLLALESTESKCSALCRCNDRCVVDSVSTSVRSKKKENKKNHHDHLSGVYIHARRPQLRQLQAVAVKYTIQKKE